VRVEQFPVPAGKRDMSSATRRNTCRSLRQ